MNLQCIKCHKAGEAGRQAAWPGDLFHLSPKMTQTDNDESFDQTPTTDFMTFNAW
jgi:hypothetical protein